MFELDDNIYTLEEAEKLTGIEKRFFVQAAARGQIRLCIVPDSSLEVFIVDLLSTDIDDGFIQSRKFKLRSRPNATCIPERSDEIDALFLSVRDIGIVSKKNKCTPAYFESGVQYRDRATAVERTPKVQFFGMPVSGEWVYACYDKGTNHKVAFDDKKGFAKPNNQVVKQDNLMITHKELDKLAYDTELDSQAHSLTIDFLWKYFDCDRSDGKAISEEDSRRMEVILDQLSLRILYLAMMSIKHWAITGPNGKFNSDYFAQDLERILLTKETKGVSKNYLDTARKLVTQRYLDEPKFLPKGAQKKLLVRRGSRPPNKTLYKEPVDPNPQNADAAIKNTSVINVLSVWKQLCMPYVLGIEGASKPTQNEIMDALYQTGIRVGDSDDPGEKAPTPKDGLPGRVSAMFEVRKLRRIKTK